MSEDARPCNSASDRDSFFVEISESVNAVIAPQRGDEDGPASSDAISVGLDGSDRSAVHVDLCLRGAVSLTLRLSGAKAGSLADALYASQGRLETSKRHRLSHLSVTERRRSCQR